MTTRNEYQLDLSLVDLEQYSAIGTDIHLKAPEAADADALADLMIDAYRGTIDYDNETVEDAMSEVQAYLGGQRGGVPLLGLSRLAYRESLLVSACLVAEWDQRQQPIIAYVMTRADAKKQGFASHVLISVLREIREAGHGGVRAVITQGNTASERLFGNLGFQKVST
ncbi:MAG TPA: GNAT family N-acetyltransferase [Anaerolineales bacterium]